VKSVKFVQSVVEKKSPQSPQSVFNKTSKKTKATMTDYSIPMIIGTALAFMLGAAFGALWGLSRHEWLYCRVTARLARIRRMSDGASSITTR